MSARKVPKAKGKRTTMPTRGRRPKIKLSENGCYEELGQPEDAYRHISPGHLWHHEKMAKRRAEKAMAGDAKHAREVLEAFIARVDQHTEATWQAQCSGLTYLTYVQFIADALRKVLEDSEVDARVALGLKSSKPGRRAGTSQTNLRALSAARALLRFHGLSFKAADSHLSARIEGASSRTIARAYKAHSEDETLQRMAKKAARDDERDFCLEPLKQHAEPYQPLIAEILGSRKQT